MLPSVGEDEMKKLGQDTQDVVPDADTDMLSRVNKHDELERKKREAEGSLQPLIERFQELAKEFDAKQFVLSDDARFQKSLDLQELRNEIENKQKHLQGQLEVDRERLVAPLRTKLVGIVEEVGRSEGFTLILMRNAPGLMYAREALDVTDLVIAKFNEKG